MWPWCSGGLDYGLILPHRRTPRLQVHAGSLPAEVSASAGPKGWPNRARTNRYVGKAAIAGVLGRFGRTCEVCFRRVPSSPYLRLHAACPHSCTATETPRTLGPRRCPQLSRLASIGVARPFVAPQRPRQALGHAPPQHAGNWGCPQHAEARGRRQPSRPAHSPVGAVQESAAAPGEGQRSARERQEHGHGPGTGSKAHAHAAAVEGRDAGARGAGYGGGGHTSSWHACAGTRDATDIHPSLW
jgi:hypothetical protein